MMMNAAQPSPETAGTLTQLSQAAAALFAANKHALVINGQRVPLHMTPEDLTSASLRISTTFPFRAYREVAQLIAHRELGISLEQLDAGFGNTDISAQQACERAQRRIEKPNIFHHNNDKLYAALYQHIMQRMQMRPSLSAIATPVIEDPEANLRDGPKPTPNFGKASARSAPAPAAAKPIPTPTPRIPEALSAEKIIRYALKAYNDIRRPTVPIDYIDIKGRSSGQNIGEARDFTVYVMAHLLKDAHGTSVEHQIELHTNLDRYGIESALLAVSNKLRYNDTTVQVMLFNVSRNLNLRSDASTALLKLHQAPSSEARPVSPIAKPQ